MQKEIELNRNQRNFLLSITHELKSPLASIHLNTETMIMRNLEKAQQSRLLSNTLKDTKRLKALVENILMAAKIENQEITLAKQDTNLTTTVQEITNRLKNSSVNKSHNFEMNIDPNIFVNGDRLAIVSIITNLIENAVKNFSQLFPSLKNHTHMCPGLSQMTKVNITAVLLCGYKDTEDFYLDRNIVQVWIMQQIHYDSLWRPTLRHLMPLACGPHPGNVPQANLAVEVLS